MRKILNYKKCLLKEDLPKVKFKWGLLQFSLQSFFCLLRRADQAKGSIQWKMPINLANVYKWLKTLITVDNDWLISRT